jgi:hypothetical protein
MVLADDPERLKFHGVDAHAVDMLEIARDELFGLRRQ